VPALWDEVRWVGGGGESVVEGCEVLGGEIGGEVRKVGEEEVVIVAGWQGSD